MEYFRPVIDFVARKRQAEWPVREAPTREAYDVDQYLQNVWPPTKEQLIVLERLQHEVIQKDALTWVEFHWESPYLEGYEKDQYLSLGWQPDKGWMVQGKPLSLPDLLDKLHQRHMSVNEFALRLLPDLPERFFKEPIHPEEQVLLKHGLEDDLLRVANSWLIIAEQKVAKYPEAIDLYPLDQFAQYGYQVDADRLDRVKTAYYTARYATAKSKLSESKDKIYWVEEMIEAAQYLQLPLDFTEPYIESEFTKYYQRIISHDMENTALMWREWGKKLSFWAKLKGQDLTEELKWIEYCVEQSPHIKGIPPVYPE